MIKKVTGCRATPDNPLTVTVRS